MTTTNYAEGNRAIADENKKSAFSVWTMHPIEKQPTHWAEGLTMYIQKNGISISLDSEEIQQLVKSLPRTFGGSY